MSIEININDDANVVLTDKLERLHRSALPVAIRQTLDNAAFDVKERTLPKISKLLFVNRTKTFFKSNSKVNKANGFNIKTMHSEVGMFENRLKGGDNHAVKDLEKQERGGSIGGKSFIPMKSARVSRSNKKNVRKINRISTINNIVNTKKVKGKNSGQKFMVAVNKAGVNGYILHKDILYRVDRISKSRKYKFKLTPLYSHKKSRSVSVKSTGFMKKASDITRKLMPKFYNENAKKQLKKAKML